jgi:AraC-like DNA-binding protein
MFYMGGHSFGGQKQISGMFQRIAFSSDELPEHLSDRARFRLWQDVYVSRYGEADMAYLPDRPFFNRSQFMQVGSIGLVQSECTLNRVTRTARHIAADARDEFLIGFLGAGSQFLLSQRKREVLATSGKLLFYTTAEATEARTSRANAWSGLCVPRTKILELVAGAEDRILTDFAPSPALRLLQRYVEFLFAPGTIENDPAVLDHIDATLLDLIALALGADGDAREIASARGMRAARAREIVALIKANYANPKFSPHEVGRKLGVSQRYLQELLQENGASFTERVLELRLQKARAMLTNLQSDRLKVSDIAYACGFSNVSYFNQAFRRRFGASPTQYRGGGEVE